MADSRKYTLVRDRRGMWWDLLLYVPTVIALLSIGAKLWFGPYQNYSYVAIFAGCFFLLIGANRILKTRLMVLPGAPVALEVSRQQVSLQLNGGSQVNLVKNVRYFPDYAGKSFGLSGMDLDGRRQQFVIHKGQFPSLSDFNDIRSYLAAYK